MKNKYISIATMIATSLFSLAVFANAYDVQYLVGEKAKKADPQLQSRGYVQVGSEKTGKNNSYGMWWNQSERQCLTVDYSHGRVDAITDSPEYDCNQSSGSDDDAKIEARIASWGRNCKNKVAEQFDVPMSDIQVSVGATEQQSIDAGDITLDDLKRYGLSFNWEVRSQYKSANGYCNTDGDGNVVEFRQ